MQYLRQSTAAVLRVGPYISAADGKTPVTGLATPTGKAIQGGTATAYTPATWADLGDGHYAANLSAGQTATTGPLRVEFPATASYLSVWEDADVVSGPWYDLSHAANGSGGIVAAGPTGTFPTANTPEAATAQTQTAALYNGSTGVNVSSGVLSLLTATNTSTGSIATAVSTIQSSLGSLFTAVGQVASAVWSYTSGRTLTGKVAATLDAANDVSGVFSSAALANAPAGGLTTPQASELAAISTAVQVLAAQPGVPVGTQQDLANDLVPLLSTAGIGTAGLTPQESANLAAVATAVALLGGGQLQYRGPVAVDGSAKIVQGDDTLLQWTVTNYTGPDLTGAVVTFGLMTACDYDRNPAATPVLTTTGSLTSTTVGEVTTVVYSVPLSAAQTATLPSSPTKEPLNLVGQLAVTTAASTRATAVLAAVTVMRRVV